jgi:peptidoglycan/LPS O-acetylase OafA/YrhL
MSTKTETYDISADLTWIDLLKGIAIIGVFFDNWTHYMEFDTTPALLYSLAKTVTLLAGPFVQVFFILSGFGLTLTYLRQYKTSWSWKRWAWRRITKIWIPYAIFVVLSFILGIIGSALYASVDMRFSWPALLSYLTLTRNFFPPTWAWNPPLWFMPVIIGLYICFPVLVNILNKWGAWALLLISAVVSYGTLALAILVGLPASHGADWFTFWMIQFALGMVLAHVRETSPQKLRHLQSPGAFLLGLALLLSSWALRTYVPLGKALNDSITSVGIFLVLLNLGWILRDRVPAAGKALTALARKSFFMYLIHYPIMEFVIGPPLRVPTNPVIVLALGGLYIVLIYFVCAWITQPIERFTSWAYRRNSQGQLAPRLTGH